MSATTTANIGAWRDRTNLFISYRQSYTHHPANRSRLPGSGHGAPYSDNDDSERAGLMADSSNDAVIEMDLLPPRWLDIQDEISQQLSDITAQMRKLDGLHAKHVLPGFDDESVKAKEERDIEALTQNITRAFSACQRAIKRIDTMLASQPDPSPADRTMAANLKRSLASRVSETSTTFRKKQSAYMRKLRSLGGLPSVDSSAAAGGRSSTPQNPYNDPAMLDSDSDLRSAQTTLSQTQTLRQRQTQGLSESTIATREREIERIAQGVIDLSNIFQELNTMVIDQGSMLDRIDYNVERTLEHVKGAEKELRIGEGYQKKGTKRRIILLLILLVVGMFILLLVKPKSRSGGTQAPPQPPIEAPHTPEEGGGLPPVVMEGREVGIGRRRAEWKQRRRRAIAFNRG